MRVSGWKMKLSQWGNVICSPRQQPPIFTEEVNDSQIITMISILVYLYASWSRSKINLKIQTTVTHSTCSSEIWLVVCMEDAWPKQYVQVMCCVSSTKYANCSFFQKIWYTCTTYRSFGFIIKSLKILRKM